MLCFFGSLLLVATGLSLFSLWALRGIGFVGDHSKIQKWKAFCKTGGNKRNVYNQISEKFGELRAMDQHLIWICFNNWCYTIGVSGRCLWPNVQAEPAWSLGSVAAHAQGWRKKCIRDRFKDGTQAVFELHNFWNFIVYDIGNVTTHDLGNFTAIPALMYLVAGTAVLSRSVSWLHSIIPKGKHTVAPTEGSH